MNGNKILVQRNGKTIQVPFIIGLNIVFKGKNNIVTIQEPCKFKLQLHKRSLIKIIGDNNSITIGSNKICSYKSFRIIDIGSNNTITFGKDIYMSDGIHIDWARANNLEFNIGDDCMIGQKVRLMLSDHHDVYDITTNEIINSPKKGIHIGKHVWIARNARIMKDVTIADNSIVALGSIVTKQHQKENVILAGAPARIVKENINWTR